MHCEHKYVTISLVKTCVFVSRTQRMELDGGRYQAKMVSEKGEVDMSDKYFVVKQKAVPEVLLKVVEAKRLLESEKVMTVQEATDAVDISRSSFYKYKDDIFPFHDNARGKTITFVLQMEDEPGILSTVLGTIAEYHANILTIHQTIPINGIASLTLSVEILISTGDSSEMIEKIEGLQGVHYLKICLLYTSDAADD